MRYHKTMFACSKNTLFENEKYRLPSILSVRTSPKDRLIELKIPSAYPTY